MLNPKPIMAIDVGAQKGLLELDER